MHPYQLPDHFSTDQPEPYRHTILKYLATNDYAAIQNLLLLNLDRLDGINTTIVVDSELFPETQITMLRDASQALPLAQRYSQDDKVIVRQNLLLRTLGVVRGIDHVLHFQFEKNRLPQYAAAKNTLKLIYQQFFSTLLKCSVAEFNDLQEQFNSQVIQLLHEMHLDTGITNAAEFKNLLAYYRDFAALIDPAMTLTTYTDCDDAETHFSLVETAVPLTKKTLAQKEQLAMMNSLVRTTTPANKNFHSAKKIAYQFIHQAFHALLQRDDRQLPAQMRKSIGPTLKNAYDVFNTLLFEHNGRSYTLDFHAVRSASLIYVGDDDTTDHNNAYALENLRQLQLNIAKKNLHITALVTDSFIHQQSTMIAGMKNAIAELNAPLLAADHPSQFHFSYVPVNLQGSIEKVQLAPTLSLLLPNTYLPTDLALFNRQQRLLLAAQIVSELADPDNEMINLVVCASGQDRTGTVLEVATTQWLMRAIRSAGIQIDQQTLDDWRGRGCHNAILATHAVPGSSGMKADVQVKGLFPSLNDRHYYRAAAYTNKTPPVDEHTLATFFADWQRQQMACYQDTLQMLSLARQSTDIAFSLLTWLQTAIAQTEAKTATERFAPPFWFFGTPSSIKQTRLDILDILSYLQDGLQQGLPISAVLQESFTRATDLQARHSNWPLLNELQQLLTVAIQKSVALTPETMTNSFAPPSGPTS